jgi:hypothetical protein
MRFEIAEHQINFFSTFGYIEFENAVPMSIIDNWKNKKEILQKPFFAKMAASLARKPKIRFLFDQIFTARGEIPKIFDQPRTLEEISCFQEVLIGALFPISLTKQEALPPPFPHTLQNILFLKADHPIDWKPLFSSHQYVLLTFGSHRSIYIYNENDPHTHDLKEKGYVFGDTLKAEDSPIFHFGPL